jgi:hypothetical protein
MSNLSNNERGPDEITSHLGHLIAATTSWGYRLGPAIRIMRSKQARPDLLRSSCEMPNAPHLFNNLTPLVKTGRVARFEQTGARNGSCTCLSFKFDLQEAIMIAFIPINKHPTAKGEAIDMDRFVNDQNLDRFRRLVFCSEAERKILLAEEKIKFIEYRR